MIEASQPSVRLAILPIDHAVVVVVVQIRQPFQYSVMVCLRQPPIRFPTDSNLNTHNGLVRSLMTGVVGEETRAFRGGHFLSAGKKESSRSR